jgi:hypothetical protein
MSYDVAVLRDHDSDDVLSSLLITIEDRLEYLEDQLTAVAPLALERQRLLRARAELLDEAPPPQLGLPPAREARVTQDDVASVLDQRPGLRAGEIAEALRAGQPAISAHLQRGKGSRFERRAGRWYLTGH